MKKLNWLKNIVSLCALLLVLTGMSSLNVKASDFDSEYCDYNFVTKTETFGEMPLNTHNETADLVEGFLGTRPYAPEIEPYSIIGTDGRIEITNTRAIPVRWIGYLQSYWADGTVTSGTAWLYGESVAMTAGHCIYDVKKGIYPMKITFSPGFDGTSSPFGTFNVTRGRVTRQYRSNGSYDVGLIKLAVPVGRDLGYFSFAYNENVDAYRDKSVGLTGYCDSKGRKMYKALGTIAGATDITLEHRMDTEKSQGGSPIFYKDPNDSNKRICIGVHTSDIPSGFSDGCNRAQRITKTMYNWMNTTRDAWGQEPDLTEPPLFTDGSEFLG